MSAAHAAVSFLLVFAATVSAEPDHLTALKNQLTSHIGDWQSCTSDSECTVLINACPFGCSFPVRKAEGKVVAKEMGLYKKEYDLNCEYKCFAPEYPRCINNKCSIVPR